MLGRVGSRSAFCLLSRSVPLRWFGASSLIAHGGPSKNADKPLVKFSFVDNKEVVYPVEAHVGDHLLEVAHRHNVDLEGACEASLACSTCHVILPHEIFDKMEEPEEEENDMLDLAFGLTETSRLGCQVFVQEYMEGMLVELPAATRNMAVDGFKPKPH